MLTTHTLNTIRSGTGEEAYYAVTNAALYLATGGYLAEGNQVLAALWNHKLPHTRNTWLPDTAFMVLWHAAGTHPEFVPFELQDIDTIEKNMRGYIALDRWGYKLPDKSWTELTGQDLLREAYLKARLVKQDPAERRDMHSILTPAPGSEPRNLEEQLALLGKFIKSTSVEEADVFPSAETELEALAMLTKMMEEGYYSGEGLALGAELAARNGQPVLAARFAKTCVTQNSASLSDMYLCSLAASRHVAPLLLQKIVAPELELSDQIVQDYTGELLKVLDSRMTQGRSLVYGHLSWKELLQKLSDTAIKTDDQNVYDQDVRQSGWLGYQGATEAEIRQVEEKLGITLPEDYRGFLAITNGFRSSCGAEPALLPVAEIDFLKNGVEPYFFDILLDSPVHEEDNEAYRENLSNAVLISKYPDEQLVWLMPENKEKDRWQAWFYASWVPGEAPHPSFRAYIEAQLESILLV